MTLDEYLLNHDANEGAEERAGGGDEVRCPVCGEVADTLFRRSDGEIVGCNVCVDVADPVDIPYCSSVCIICGKYSERVYFKDGEILGCEHCIEIVPYYEA